MVSYEIVSSLHFIENGTFIVQNKEILKRLVYSLQLRIANNLSSVRDYKNMKEIENFYNDMHDYSQTDDVVFKDFDIFQKMDHTVYDRLQPSKPAYFMNLNSLPVLIKEAQTVEEARGSLSSNILFHIYNSKNDIKQKYIDKQSSADTNVLLYKKDDVIHAASVSFL